MNFTGKVLLTDDEAHIRKFIGLVLKRLGSPVIIEAANGQEAVSLYEKHKPDLVLLDVNMPIMDGVQALTQIMQKDPQALVIMLTSLTNRQIVEQCATLGALDYLRKDLPRDEMIALLTKIIADCFGPEDSSSKEEAAAP
jgi:two-component system chemotaxis response regulator CheY